jgi:hypothetical protein
MPIPNVVQFTAGTPTVSSFKYNNFYLGVQNQDYGPTSRTGFYAGPTGVTYGYVIYFDKTTDGPSIYVPQTDNDARSILLQFYSGIIPVGQQGSLSSILNALYQGGSRTDSIILNKDYENILTDNLYISIDPSFYLCTTASGGTPNSIKNMVLPNLTDVSNNMVFNSAEVIQFNNQSILNFDAVDDEFIFFDFNIYNEHLRFSGDVTYEFFVRLNELTGGTTPIPMYYKSPVHEGSLTANSSGYLVYSYGNGTDVQSFTATTALTNNTWYHIVLVRDFTNTKKLYWYINGSEDSNVLTDYISAATSTDSTTIFQNGPGGQEFALADLGVLRIYNSALTAAQVSQNFNAQKSRFGL